MTDDRNDPAIRKGALLLSSLVLTPREGLEAYRDRRVANKDVDLELLEKARAVLDAVGFILRSESAADWRKLERAHEALRGVKAPSDADDAEEAAAEGSAAPPAADRAREDTAWSAPTERAVVPPGVTSTVLDQQADAGQVRRSHAQARCGGRLAVAAAFPFEVRDTQRPEQPLPRVGVE